MIIVQLNREITSEFATSLPLYKPRYDAREFKICIVSGWGAVHTDDRTSDIGTEHVERNLHYMKIQLRGPDFCRGHIPKLSFNTSLICGVGKMDQKTAKVIGLRWFYHETKSMLKSWNFHYSFFNYFRIHLQSFRLLDRLVIEK